MKQQGFIMVPPKPPFKGSCLCGSVTVHVTAPPMLTLACHCLDCQKLTASAYSLTTMFPKAHFSCTGELVKGGLKASGRAHYFCKSCLNFVYSEIGEKGERINLRTSVLDNAGLFAPFVEVMSDQKIPWVNVPATRSFSSYPESLEELQALMNEYAQL